MASQKKSVVAIDVGTFHLIAARRNNEEIEYRTEINGFIEIENKPQHKTMIAMMKAAKAPMMKVEDTYFVLGSKAHELAYSWEKKFRRPMRDGILSNKEKDAFNVLSSMIRTLISPLPGGETIVSFSSPAKPINLDTVNEDFHRRVLLDILKKPIDDKKIIASPMNEAMAICWAEAAATNYTCFALSLGAGMANVCCSVWGAPVFTFSIVGSGDYIDYQSAERAGEEIVTANVAKREIDLVATPKTALERAIVHTYEIVIDNVLENTARLIKQDRRRITSDVQLPMVIAGGTAMPQGFLETFIKRMELIDFGDFKFGEVRLAEDLKNTVARGLLIGGENTEL